MQKSAYQERLITQFCRGAHGDIISDQFECSITRTFYHASYPRFNYCHTPLPFTPNYTYLHSIKTCGKQA